MVYTNHLGDLGKMLQNDPSAAKIGVDTAEIGPRKKYNKLHHLKDPDGASLEHKHQRRNVRGQYANS